MIGKLKSGAKKLIKNGLGDVFISSIYSELIGFVVSIFIVRMLDKDVYGYYAIAYNSYSYIAVFIGCGLNNAILQYCSEKRSDDEKQGIYYFCLKFGSLVNVAIFGIIHIFSFLLTDMPRHFLLMMSGWPFVVYLSNYYLMRLRVKKDNRHFMLSNVLSASIFVAFAAILVWFTGVIGYVIALYLKHIISFALACGYTQKDNINKKKIEIPNTLKKELVRYSIICCLTNFASTIMMLLDVTCINYFINDPSVVATYKTATQIPTALLFIPSSMIVFIFPYLAEHNQDLIWLKNNVKKLTIGMFAINLFFGGLVYILAPCLVKILWGERYIDAVKVLRILVVNFILSGTFNKVYGNLMVAVRKVNVNLVKTIVCSILNIVLNVIFIFNHGSIGAAYATLIVTVVSSIFSYVYYQIWMQKSKMRNKGGTL